MDTDDAKKARLAASYERARQRRKEYRAKNKEKIASRQREYRKSCKQAWLDEQERKKSAATEDAIKHLFLGSS